MTETCIKDSVDIWNEVTLFRSVKWEFDSSDSAGQQDPWARVSLLILELPWPTAKYTEKSPGLTAAIIYISKVRISPGTYVLFK